MSAPRSGGWSRLARALGDDLQDDLRDEGVREDGPHCRAVDESDDVRGVAGDRAFIGRVMAALPAPLRGAGLRPDRRMRLLAAFHLGGALLLLVLWCMVPELSAAAAAAVHRWASDGNALGTAAGLGTAGSPASWPVVIGALAALFGVVLALAPTRVDTRPT